MTPPTGEPMPRNAKRDIEATCSAAAFAAKLRRLADAVEAGRPFAIQVAGERLHVPAHAAFSIEHELARTANELEFQLRWETRHRAPGTPRR